MPTVPRYQRQVDEQGFPNFRVSPESPIEAFGGGKAVARSTEANANLLNTSNTLFQNAKKKADDAATTDAFAQLVQRENQITYSDKDAAVTRKGRQVLETDFFKDYNERYDKAADEVATGLKSATALDMFNKIRQERKTGFNSVLDRHFATQRQEYKKESASSGVAALTEDAVNNHFMHERVLDDLGKQEAIIRDQAASEGLSAEGSNRLVLEHRSDTYKGIINSMTAAKNYHGAKALFDRITMKSAPGMIKKGNIDWANLPASDDDGDGKSSSTITMGFEEDGKEILVPTFWDGARHSDQEAIARYHETGQHLGVFKDAKSADQYVKQDLHPAQDRHGQGFVYDNLTAKDKAHIERVLEVAGVDDESLRLAQSIIAKHPDDMAAQFAARDKIKDDKVYDAVTRRLDRLNSERNAVAKQQKENDILQAADYIKNTQGAFGDDLEKIPPDIRTRLDQKDLKIVESLVYPPLETHWGSYTELWDMAANDPKKFLALNLLEYRPFLADQDYRALNKQKGLMEARDEKSKEAIENYKVSTSTLNTYAKQLNLKPNAKPNSIPGKEYTAFAQTFKEAVLAKQKLQEKPLNSTEVDAIGKELATKTAVARTLRHPFTTEEQIGKVSASQIPDDENRVVINELKRRNAPITDENRIKLWRIWKGLGQ